MVENLLKRIINDDKHALYEVYKYYKPIFIKYCLKHHTFSYTPEELNVIETIYDDAIIALRRNCKSGKLKELERASLKTYIFSIGNNIIKNYFRSIGQENRKVPFDDMMQSSEDNIYEQDDITLQAINLLKSGKVGEPCKELLIYFFYDNYSLEVIKERMNFPTANAVAQQKKRCLERLRTMIRFN